MPRPTDQLRSLARLGAQARLREIADEVASIHRAFPGLRSSGRAPSAQSRPSAEPPAPAAAKTPGRRRRRRGKLSAAGRARIIAAQKARWAKVRAEKKK